MGWYHLDCIHLRDPIKSYHRALKNVNSNESLVPLWDKTQEMGFLP